VAALLYVHAGEQAARASFVDEGRARWATGLAAVLEKHGYLDARSCDVAAARAEIAADPPAVVVVGRLSPEEWAPELAETLAAGRFGVLLEQPPPQLHATLGIDAVPPSGHEGRLSACEPSFAEGVRRRSGGTVAKISGPLSRPIAIEPEMRWQATAAPIDEDRARAWNAPGWSAQRWSVAAPTTVLAEWQPVGEAATPAIVRRGRVAALAVELLAYLAQAHSAAPSLGPQHSNWPRAVAAEAMLLELIDSLHATVGATRLRIRPWPHRRTWALNVRHDVDRLPSRRAVAELLGRHRAAGTAATLYVRPRHLSTSHRFVLGAAVRTLLGSHAGEPPRAIGNLPRRPAQGPIRALRAALGRPDIELALHAEGMWAGGAKEVEAFTRAFGRPPVGASSHGGPDCFRFQGAPNVLWAQKMGLDYTELIVHTHTLPHRFVDLRADGTVAVERILCLPHHESFDRPGAVPPNGAAAINSRLDLWRQTGGLLQVMNHPDLNLDELFAFLAELPRDGRIDTTAADAADWWRRSHVGDELELSSERSGATRLWSRRGVEGIVVEALSPDGRERTFELSLAPEQSTTVTVDPWAAA
jgi:hypothetical protein